MRSSIQLPANEREQVAAALWESLDAESGLTDISDVDLLAETTKCRAEIENGSVKTITHEQLKTELGR